MVAPPRPTRGFVPPTWLGLGGLSRSNVYDKDKVRVIVVLFVNRPSTNSPARAVCVRALFWVESKSLEPKGDSK